jgi:two-component system CheB/CheR fusion protein
MAHARSAARKLAGIRILVVDDDENILSALVDGLSLFGASVTGSPSAASARANLAHGRFDLLISDINMPHEDGCQLISSIRALAEGPTRTIVAVALTATPEAMCGRALAAGFDGIVSKLIGLRELVDQVSALARTKPQPLRARS